MAPRKRKFEETVETPEAVAVEEELSPLQRVRGMWEFAALLQYLFFFAKAVKIEEIEVEAFEQELLLPGHSARLSKIGLQLLKQVSSHKGLTPDIFDDYTRRQYQAKAPQRNPFGEDELPLPFADFDIYTKVKVLHQLSVWTLNNPNTIREKMGEVDETQWRIEPIGWDVDDRQYFVFDDDRLYRRTEPPIPADPKPKPKAKPKKTRNTRSNKRRRVSRTIAESSADEENADVTQLDGLDEQAEDDGTDGGYRWDLVAITLEEYTTFLDTIRKSRDPNEKILYKSIQENVIPTLHARAEEREREAVRRQKELEVMQKLATAKRSSRLAGKQEKEKLEREAQEAEQKRLADLEMARKEQQRQAKMEEERQSRMMTREQRIKDREVKRILHEEQLKKEEEQLKALEAKAVLDEADERQRISERHLKAEMKRRQQELEELQQQDEDWEFDCSVCGLHGLNVDDGTHSVACEKCNVWQHSKCHGITQEQAERDDFHFICKECKNKANKPIPPLKLNFAASPTSEAKAAPSTNPQSAQARPNANGTTPSSNQTPSQPKKAESSLVYPGPPPAPPAANTGYSAQQPPGSPAKQTTKSTAETKTQAGTSRPTTNGHSISNGSSSSQHYRPHQTHNSSQAAQQAPAGQQHPQATFVAYTPNRPQQYSHTNGHNTYSPLAASTPRTSFPPPTSSPIVMRPGSAHAASPSHQQQATPGSQLHQMQRQPLLPGSSPGYSPEKHSPPTPGGTSTGATHQPPPPFPAGRSLSASFSMPADDPHMQHKPVVPPVTLSPTNRPMVLSPPVKHATPERMRVVSAPVNRQSALSPGPAPGMAGPPSPRKESAVPSQDGLVSPKKREGLPVGFGEQGRVNGAGR